MTTQNMSGRCLCGAVRFEASEVETALHACHCGMCRRWAGGPVFGAAVGALALAGEENVSVYKSSEWLARAFCKICGGHLFFQVQESGQRVVCAAALDATDTLQLAGEIFIDDKPAFYELAGERPRQTGAEFFASTGVAAE